MHVKQAIILAGGLGTRLRDAVPDLPKCMAPINNRPFLAYLIDFYRSQGIEHFIFSLGYRHEIIEAFLDEYLPVSSYSTVTEKEPLGTGGGIALACHIAQHDNLLVLNGDTFFAVDIHELAEFHVQQHLSCTLALKPMKNFNRYGVVTLNANALIEQFREKAQYEEGLINGGVYVLNRQEFLSLDLPDKFSFEKDYLEKSLDVQRIGGFISDSYFIDIGIPEDYYRAQEELIQHI